jgi:hypothetical protein
MPEQGHGFRRSAVANRVIPTDLQFPNRSIHRSGRLLSAAGQTAAILAATHTGFRPVSRKDRPHPICRSMMQAAFKLRLKRQRRICRAAGNG